MRGSVHLFGVVLIAFVLVGVVLFHVLHDRSDQVVTSVPALTSSLTVLTTVVHQTLTSSFQASVVSGGDISVTFMRMMGEREVGLESTNLYGLVRAGDFVIMPVPEGWELQMQGIFVAVREGESSIRRTFNATIVVDSSGNLVRNIYK